MIEHHIGHRTYRVLTRCGECDLLFVPDWHAEHPDALAVAEAMGAAAAYARDWLPNAEFNLITSSGRAATQTIDHVHVHLVPRRPGDGLLLPWSPHP